MLLPQHEPSEFTQTMLITYFTNDPDSCTKRHPSTLIVKDIFLFKQ